MCESNILRSRVVKDWIFRYKLLAEHVAHNERLTYLFLNNEMSKCIIPIRTRQTRIPTILLFLYCVYILRRHNVKQFLTKSTVKCCCQS